MFPSVGSFILHFSDTGCIKVSDRLREDLHLDSMSSLMFLMKLEESISGFYVDPETLDPDDLESVSSVIRYVDMQVMSRENHVY